MAGLLLGSIGLQLVDPQFLRFFIDMAAAQASNAVLARAALLFILAALLNQALSVGATYASENLAWSATNGLREDLAMHCLRLNTSFHKAHTPAR